MVNRSSRTPSGRPTTSHMHLPHGARRKLAPKRESCFTFGEICDFRCHRSPGVRGAAVCRRLDDDLLTSRSHRFRVLHGERARPGRIVCGGSTRADVRVTSGFVVVGLTRIATRCCFAHPFAGRSPRPTAVDSRRSHHRVRRVRWADHHRSPDLPALRGLAVQAVCWSSFLLWSPLSSATPECATRQLHDVSARVRPTLARLNPLRLARHLRGAERISAVLPGKSPCMSASKRSVVVQMAGRVWGSIGLTSRRWLPLIFRDERLQLAVVDAGDI